MHLCPAAALRKLGISAQNPSDHCRLNCQGDSTLITELNYAIDAYRISWDINEAVIENILHQWEQHDKHNSPVYWLVAARIFEMAILCAGHYVDSCEFEAAGDLLFNPRKILIYLSKS